MNIDNMNTQQREMGKKIKADRHWLQIAVAKEFSFFTANFGKRIIRKCIGYDQFYALSNSTDEMQSGSALILLANFSLLCCVCCVMCIHVFDSMK